MKIPVSHLTKFGSIIGSIVFNTDTLKFEDSNVVYNRNLPCQDILSCSILSNGCVTIVGYNKLYDSFVVCFGDTHIYELRRLELKDYYISNFNVMTNVCIDGNLPDFSYLFSCRYIIFKRMLSEKQKSSIGQASKFFGSYKGRDCIVKFSKFKSDEDLYNELLYKKVADVLGVLCCGVKLIDYGGKKCIVSLYEYKVGADCFISFKNTCKSVEQIYLGLCDSDKIMFDMMMFLDYIMLQQDRHMSNIALCNNRLYPLFDNGECLGIGSIGVFSSNFRRYVESKNWNNLMADWYKVIKICGSKGELVRNNLINLGVVI